VRFSHSVFALPFALAGALLASQRVPIAWSAVGLIVLVSSPMPTPIQPISPF